MEHLQCANGCSRSKRHSDGQRSQVPGHRASPSLWMPQRANGPWQSVASAGRRSEAWQGDGEGRALWISDGGCHLAQEIRTLSSF